MFQLIKNWITETNQTSIAPTNLPVTYSCGHQGRRSSQHSHMVSPRVLEQYIEYLGTTQCAECAALQTATVKVQETSAKGAGMNVTTLRPAF